MQNRRGTLNRGRHGRRTFPLAALILVVVLALALAACAPAPQTSGGGQQQQTQAPVSDKVYTLKYQHSYPPTLSFYKETGGQFIRNVEAWSNGRIKFEVFEAGAVAPVGEMVDAVHTGVIDVSQSWGGFYVGIVPEADVETGMPLAWKEPWEVFDAYYNRGMREVIAEAYESKFNLKHFPAIIGMQYAISTKADINSLDDLKGMKIRALGAYGDFVKALGASPVVVPGPEIFTAMQLGTIDGLLYDAEAVVASGLEQFTKTVMVDPHLNAGSAHWLINRDTWNSLPPDLQQVIEDAVQYGNARAVMDYRAVAEKNVAIMKAKGVKALILSSQDQARMLTIATELWDQIGKRSPLAAKGVEIVKQQQRDYGRMK